jgi:hypothetical protein
MKKYDQENFHGRKPSQKDYNFLGTNGIDALLSNAMRSADLTDILCLALEICLEQPQNQSIVQQVQGQSLEFDESLS